MGFETDDRLQKLRRITLRLLDPVSFFADHHAVYPTFTMMNSASIATGTYPGAHGFYGNVVYAPLAKGRNAKGRYPIFPAGVHRRFWRVEAVRELPPGQATLVRRCCKPHKPKG